MHFHHQHFGVYGNSSSGTSRQKQGFKGDEKSSEAWQNSCSNRILPDPDYLLKSTTIKLGEEAGFILDKVEGNLWNYTVRFKAQKSM